MGEEKEGLMLYNGFRWGGKYEEEEEWKTKKKGERKSRGLFVFRKDDG